MRIRIALIVLLLSVCCAAQTISPVISEVSKKYKGEVTVTNNGITPMIVTLQPFLFSLHADGSAEFRPLDNTVDLKLDEMSARISPKDSHIFSYKLVCNVAPCLVTIKVAMVIGHTNDGLQIRAILPSVIYADEKAKGARARARLAAGIKN